jgi:hypothetical protein
MANTYLDLLTDIADESRRPLASYRTQIERCVADAIAMSEPETYWFNDTDALTFDTVASQESYGEAALSTIPYITEFHDVKIAISSTDKRQLFLGMDRDDCRRLHAAGAWRCRCELLDGGA